MNDKIEQINELLNNLNEEERQTVLDSYTSQELLRKVWNNNDVIVPNYYDVDYIVYYNRCTREDAERIIEYINDGSIGDYVSSDLLPEYIAAANEDMEIKTYDNLDCKTKEEIDEYVKENKIESWWGFGVWEEFKKEKIDTHKKVMFSKSVVDGTQRVDFIVDIDGVQVHYWDYDIGADEFLKSIGF